MTRDDLLFVGMRLMGLYWVGQGITALSYIYWVSRMMGREGLDGFTADYSLQAVLHVVIGVGLFFYSPRVVEWMAKRETSGKTGQQGDSTDAASPRR